MSTKLRTSLPLIWAGIAALLFLLNAGMLRFNLVNYLQLTDVPSTTQLFASQVSARDLAWSLFMAIFLIRRDTRLIAWLFLLRIAIELQDVLTLFVGIGQGAQPASMIGAGIFTLILIALHGLAASVLFKRLSTNQ